MTTPPARLELLVHAEPGTPLADTLAEVGVLYEHDPVRLRVTAAVMQWWAQRMIEEAAIAEHVDRRDAARRQRAAETRARRAVE